MNHGKNLYFTCVDLIGLFGPGMTYLHYCFMHLNGDYTHLQYILQLGGNW